MKAWGQVRESEARSYFPPRCVAKGCERVVKRQGDRCRDCAVEEDALIRMAESARSESRIWSWIGVPMILADWLLVVKWRVVLTVACLVGGVTVCGAASQDWRVGWAIGATGLIWAFIGLLRTMVMKRS